MQASLSMYRFLLTEKDLPNLLQGICDRLIAQKLNISAWMVLLDDEMGGIITAEAGLEERFAPIMTNLRSGILPDCGRNALEETEGRAVLCLNCTCGVCGEYDNGTADRAVAVAIRCRKGLYGFLVVQLPASITPESFELDQFRELSESIGQALRQLFAVEESKQREDELKRVEERFELALYASQAGLWDWNIKTGEMYTSPDRKEFLDYREGGDSENGGLVALEGRIHPDDKPRVLEILNDHLSGKSDEYRIEYRVKDKKGEWAWYLDRGRVVKRDEKNMPVRMTGTHQNITRQKKQDEALAAVQQQLHEAVDHERIFLQSVIDGAGDPVVAIDVGYNILLMNSAAARLMRNSVDASDARGKKCYQLFHGSDRPCNDSNFPCPVKEVRKKDKRATLVHNPFHGNSINNTFEIEVTPLRDNNGEMYGIIEVARDITDRLRIEKELRESQSRLYRLAHHDTLTELPNRLLFRDRLDRAIIKARRNKTRVAILFLDLDHFKAINDSLGHDVGDELLIEVAGRLQNQCRQSDTVARLGGDEFVFILDDISNGKDAAIVATKIMNALRRPIEVNGHELNISTSIGIGIYPDDFDTIDGVIKCADTALYQAKDEGRSNFKFFKN